MIRSMLFVPGNSPGMLQNADVYGADAIIFDLEDAVAPDQKDAARVLVRNAVRALDYGANTLIVRVNPLDSPYIDADLSAVVPLKPHMIMPTKVGSEACVRALDEKISALERKHNLPVGEIHIMPLIETAEGIENAYNIARASARVKALFLGAEDYSADLRAHRTKRGDEILYARGRLVNAARAAGIDAFDTPFTDVDDEQGLIEDARRARSLGFSGKAIISPKHARAVNDVFTPALSEIEYAREVLSAISEAKRLGKGAVALRGKMIDKPVVERARRVIDMARALGLEERNE